MVRWRNALIVGVAVFGVAVVLGLAMMPEAVPTVTVRGAVADSQTFSMTTLRSADDRAFVDQVHRQVFDRCMAKRGFTHRPSEADYNEDGGPPTDYAKDWGAAAVGDDGKSYPSGSTPSIPTQLITLADGRTHELHVTWTSDTCWWKSYTRLGVDPLVYESLRQIMTQLVVQADRAASEELGDVSERWADCLGATEVDPGTLLRALDRIDELRSPYGAKTSQCLTDDIRAEATRIRARDHLRVAAANDVIVQQWTKTLDTELAAARAFEG
ncbi:MAG TPA: hypothetical protein VFK52_10545 [Nocardioidaceae bacterium]|nr:hypothetical protein [Nocardioidaceae bacterium]